MKWIKTIFTVFALIFVFNPGNGQAVVYHNVVVFATTQCGGVFSDYSHLTVRPDGSAVLQLRYTVEECNEGNGADVLSTTCIVAGIPSNPGIAVVTPSGKRKVSCTFPKGSLSFLVPN